MSRSGIDDNVVGTASILNIVEATVMAGGTGTGDPFVGADTNRKVSANSIVKYLNIRLETGVRDVAPRAPGFQEFAIVVFEEQQANPIVDAVITAGLGTQTLGDLCRNLYRGNCIWHGAYAVSKELPRVVDIPVKLPEKFCKQKRGQVIALLKASHTVDVSDTTTDFRSLFHFDYKCYI